MKKFIMIFIVSLISLTLLTWCWSKKTIEDNNGSASGSLNTNPELNMKKEIKWTVTLDLNSPLAWKTLIFDIEMMKIDSGKVVASWSKIEVNYNGTLEDWTKFDSSYDRGQTLPFTVWAWQMIPWFDNAVLWMKVWEKKNVKLSPAEAYWEYDPQKTQVVPKKDLESFLTAWYKLVKWEKLPTQMWELTIIESTDE